MKLWCIVFVVGLILLTKGWAWGSDKVLLRDLSAITLHEGRTTTGRRSSPVPQLKCMGGTAGCGAFVPKTVQCRNVGYDGYDVQWECKTDMDDSYRFGKIQVTCEGYDHPDDPYVLKGSCGLEYTIDLTDAGKTRNQNYGGGYSYSPSWNSSEESSGGWFIFFVVVFAVVFLICKMSPSNDEVPGTNHDPHDSRFRDGHRPNSSNTPPPYGFKPEYSQSHTHHPPPPSYSDATNTAQHSTTRTNTDSGSSTGGGFWSGLGLGTLGGYLFGSRRSRHYGGWGNGGWGNSWGNGGWGNSWGNRGWGNSWGGGSGWGSSWGNNRGSSWGSGSTTYRGSRQTTSSSGTSRTASGFGGTSRR